MQIFHVTADITKIKVGQVMKWKLKQFTDLSCMPL
jgi:hypothetical protein